MPTQSYVSLPSLTTHVPSFQSSPHIQSPRPLANWTSCNSDAYSRRTGISKYSTCIHSSIALSSGRLLPQLNLAAAVHTLTKPAFSSITTIGCSIHYSIRNIALSPPPLSECGSSLTEPCDQRCTTHSIREDLVPPRGNQQISKKTASLVAHVTHVTRRHSILPETPLLHPETLLHISTRWSWFLSGGG